MDEVLDRIIWLTTFADPPLRAGLLLGGIFFSGSVVDGSLWPGLAEAGIVVRFQSVAADEHFPDCFHFLLNAVGQRVGTLVAALLGFMLGRLRRGPACDAAGSSIKRVNSTDEVRIMHFSPDHLVFWEYGFLKLNATIAYTWGIMLTLVIGFKNVTGKLSVGPERSRWQNLLEVVVIAIEKHIEDVGLRRRTLIHRLYRHPVFVCRR